MRDRPPSGGRRGLTRLRKAGVRLAAELDEARFHHAAAYVAMALEAMDATPEAAVNDNSGCNDVECYFDLDEHNRVWMYLEGDPYIIGRREAARAEMWRFLRVLLPGLE